VAKQSSKDVLIARIDKDIARLQDIGDYMNTHSADEIETDIAELQRIKCYVMLDGASQSADPKPRNGRKSKRGLPKAQTAPAEKPDNGE